jgi:glucokinase
MNKVAAGIDIGGTNTVFAWVDEAGKVLWRNSISTTAFSSAKELVAEVCHQLKESLEGTAIGLGIGAPSANFYTGCIEHAPNLNWGDIIPLQQYFEEEMQLPAIVTNDANAAAIGEQVYGTAKGMKDFMMVTLGTGLGSGFVANGELIYGHDGFAGELGHTIIEPNGRTCGCGRKGCLETYASATGMQKTAIELSGKEHSSKEVAEAAERGEEWALKAFDMTAQKLGLALANSVAITRPEAIILFGGLAQAGDLLFGPTKRYMEENLLHNYQNKIPLLASALPQSDAAVLGASALVWKSQQ